MLIRFVLSLALSGLSLGAHANYNFECIFQLTNPARPTVRSYIHEHQITDICTHLRRLESPVSYLNEMDHEALYDALHGLRPIVRFTDESTHEMSHEAESLRLFSDLFAAKTHVVWVKYPEAELNRVGQMLKHACTELRLDGCEIYDEYRGLMDTRLRPFVPVQELILKWAVLWSMRVERALDRVRALPAWSRTEKNKDAEKLATANAFRLFREYFKAEQVVILMDHVFRPHFQAELMRVKKFSDADRPRCPEEFPTL